MIARALADIRADVAPYEVPIPLVPEIEGDKAAHRTAAE